MIRFERLYYFALFFRSGFLPAQGSHLRSPWLELQPVPAEKQEQAWLHRLERGKIHSHRTEAPTNESRRLQVPQQRPDGAPGDQPQIRRHTGKIKSTFTCFIHLIFPNIWNILKKNILFQKWFAKWKWNQSTSELLTWFFALNFFKNIYLKTISTQLNFLDIVFLARYIVWYKKTSRRVLSLICQTWELAAKFCWVSFKICRVRWKNSFQLGSKNRYKTW